LRDKKENRPQKFGDGGRQSYFGRRKKNKINTIA
jgi:hypothetical protein